MPQVSFLAVHIGAKVLKHYVGKITGMHELITFSTFRFLNMQVTQEEYSSIGLVKPTFAL